MAIVSRSIDFTKPLGPGVSDNGQGQLNLDLQTVRGDKPIRLNSRTTSETSGNLIGLQCKPGANGGDAATASVKGAEFSPRFASGTAGGSLIGASFDPILQGSSGAGGDLSGAFRGLEINLTDGNGGTRTITGASAGIRIFQQLATKTFTNGLFPLQVEAKGGGVDWTAFALLPNDSVIAATTGSPANLPANTAWVKVQIGTDLFRLPGYHPTS
jgi:hypothetical protein